MTWITPAARRRARFTRWERHDGSVSGPLVGLIVALSVLAVLSALAVIASRLARSAMRAR